MAAASAMNWMNWLLTVALGLAAVGLVASFAVPGPALVGSQGSQGDLGPQGPQGPQGDTGVQGVQGTIVAWNVNSGLQALTPTCSNYVGAAGTITIPGPGVVIVTANAEVQIELLDREDEVGVFLDTRNGTTEGCVLDGYQGLVRLLNAFGNPGAPDPHLVTTGVFVQEPFLIDVEGTYTIYLNVILHLEARHQTTPSSSRP